MKNKFLMVYTGLFPVLLFVFLELLNPASGAGLFSSPFSSLPSFFVSILFLAVTAAFFYGIIGSVFVSYTVVTGVWLIIYIVNFFKLSITGGVFVPTDIMVASAAMGVMEGGSISVTFWFVIRVLLILLLLVPLWFVELKVKFKPRLIAVLVSAVLLVTFFTEAVAKNIIFPSLGLYQGTISDTYRDHGIVLGFYTALIEHFTVPNVDIDSIHLLSLSANHNEITVQEDAPVNPNIIVIMSEAFIDPTVIYNLTFSRDPVPNFRRLAEEYASGRLLVPVYGGGTANTELEFISAMPHVFFGSRFYVPFENPNVYFRRDIISTLPAFFRGNGYRTVGLHTFHGDFFNRNEIYPRLGFDEFISKDQMPEAEFKGPFISDEYFTTRIINEIIRSEESGEPLFLFGISMQNHWGFDPLKYGTLDLDVLSSSDYLDERELQIINSFLQGVFDADKQLARLVEFVEESETPTIIVFFGDHLPIMGLHSDRIFESLNWLTSQDDHLWTLEDRTKVFTTPYLVWNNFDAEFDFGDLSVYLLSAFIAQASGLPLSRHFVYTLSSANYFRGLTNELYLDIYGEFHPAWENLNNLHINALKALWYINFFGRDGLTQSMANPFVGGDTIE